jgi:threonine synthase
MQFYSTKNEKLRVSLKTAIMDGLPKDNGLYMPTSIPSLSADFIQNIDKYSFQDLSFIVANNLIGRSIPKKVLQGIIENSITFPAPLVNINSQISTLELFHGPSLAFKDFGARFMAQTMSYLNRNESKELTILVATSGDTGGAVAAGFFKTPGIKIVILYPSGKVSPLQEKQLTTLGHNVTALEIKGTFDDCQAIVKQAFLDKELNTKLRLSSANSINIARLIPQSFYYFEAFKQVIEQHKKDIAINFSVPSGNFGNLTAGLFAKRMGLPINNFLAATNANDVVPTYLSSGIYNPKQSTRTLSNAMDVGNPSNFYRMLDLYCSTWNNMKKDIFGYSYTDEETEKSMLELDHKYKYTSEPHGAIAYLAAKEYLKNKKNEACIFLGTAHPAKFLEDVESILNKQIEIPERLLELREKKKESTLLNTDYKEFFNWAISTLK